MDVRVEGNPVAAANKLIFALRNKAIRIAMNKAASPIKAAVISDSPVRTGALKKAFRIKVKRYRAGGVWAAIIGASVSYQVKGRRPARYLHLVEKKKHILAGAFSRARTTFISTVADAVDEQVKKLGGDK